MMLLAVPAKVIVPQLLLAEMSMKPAEAPLLIVTLLVTEVLIW